RRRRECGPGLRRPKGAAWCSTVGLVADCPQHRPGATAWRWSGARTTFAKPPVGLYGGWAAVPHCPSTPTGAGRRPPLCVAPAAGFGRPTCNSIEKGSMRGYKDQDLKERLARAAKARQEALDKFRARPPADDPEVIKRREERAAIAA